MKFKLSQAYLNYCFQLKKNLNELINSIILGIYFAKFDGLENTFFEKVITGQFECYGTIELRQA